MATGPKNQLALDRNQPLMARVKNLEDLMHSMVEDKGQLIQSIQEALNTVEDRRKAAHGLVSEILNAVMKVMGQDFADKVSSTIEEGRKERMTEQSNKEVKHLKDLLETNKVKLVETVSDTSTLVCREFNKEGQLVHPGRLQIHFSELHDTLKPQVLKQTPGFMFDSLNGSKIEVLEVYEEVPQMEATPAPEVASNA